MEVLPEDCLCEILSRTSPPDVCRFSAISRGFKVLAGLDIVWNKFIPSNLHEILSTARSPPGFYSTKKQLCLCLVHEPLILYGGNRSFALDRESGKKCYMLGGRELTIACKNNTGHWRRLKNINSRFDNVAFIWTSWRFDISCKIETRILSPNTVYVAFLVYKPENSTGLISYPINVFFKFNDNWEGENLGVMIRSPELNPWKPIRKRKGGWLEVELGEFIVDPDNNKQLLIHLFKAQRDFTMCGLLVEGIEFRPKVIAV